MKKRGNESGLLNCTAFDRVYQAHGHAIVCSQYETVFGRVQDRDGHPALLVDRAIPYKPCLLEGRATIPIGTADFLVG